MKKYIPDKYTNRIIEIDENDAVRVSKELSYEIFQDIIMYVLNVNYVVTEKGVYKNIIILDEDLNIKIDKKIIYDKTKISEN